MDMDMGAHNIHSAGFAASSVTGAAVAATGAAAAAAGLSTGSAVFFVFLLLKMDFSLAFRFATAFGAGKISSSVKMIQMIRKTKKSAQ